MPIPVQFSVHGPQRMDALGPEDAYHTITQAIAVSNKIFSPQEISVTLIQQLSPKPPEKPELLDARYNMLLGIRTHDGEEQIDMMDLKALDEVSIKSVDDLAKEIVAKVNQHMEAKKIAHILFSKSGSKFDTRPLEKHTVSIDDADYLRVDHRRVAIATDSGYWVLKALQVRSYTIFRLINEDGKIRIFDDYDLVRENKKGMLIDVSKVHHLAVEQLGAGSRQSAESYNGEYFLVERDEITPPTKHRLEGILFKLPSP